jgi:hypothetical protein
MHHSVGTGLDRALRPYLVKRLSGELEDFNLALQSGTIRWESGSVAADPDTLLAPPKNTDVEGALHNSASSTRSDFSPLTGRLFPIPSLFGDAGNRCAGNGNLQGTWSLRFIFPYSFQDDPSFHPSFLGRCDTASVADAVLASLTDMKSTHGRWVDDSIFSKMVSKWTASRHHGSVAVPYTLDCSGSSTVEFEVSEGRVAGYVLSHVTAPGGLPLRRVAIPDVVNTRDIEAFYAHKSRVELLDRSRRSRDSEVRNVEKRDTHHGMLAQRQRSDMSAFLLDISGGMLPMGEHDGAPGPRDIA